MKTTCKGEIEMDLETEGRKASLTESNKIGRKVRVSKYIKSEATGHWRYCGYEHFRLFIEAEEYAEEWVKKGQNS